MPAKIEIDLPLLTRLYRKLKSIDKVAARYTEKTGIGISRTLVKRRLVRSGLRLHGPQKIDKNRKKKKMSSL